MNNTPKTNNLERSQGDTQSPIDQHRAATEVSTLTQKKATESNSIEIPQISLPKGGGALKGIDETFKVNPSNGTASFNIPLPITTGRNGFAPSLSLSYSSGGGNSPFGLGWSINPPTIQRRTDLVLPRYRDGQEEDVFVLAGQEDLVPILEKVNGLWVRVEIEDDSFKIHPFRPRVEGEFARIERIFRKSDRQVYWKVTTRENVVSFFGLSNDTRLHNPNPDDESLAFSWLLEFSYDDKGNWIKYEYEPEDLVNVPNELSERNRHEGLARFTNRYLKRVKYGNAEAWYNENSPYAPELPNTDTGYFFELVLDYGEHKDPSNPNQVPDILKIRPWENRPDPYSSYRSGFEIRTYRQCYNILMFHHFIGEKEILGYDPDGKSIETDFGGSYLVRSLELSYEPSSINDSGHAEVSYLKELRQTGYIRKSDESYAQKSLPPLVFDYQNLNWNREVRTVDQANIANAPVGLSNNYQWVDLYGEGINGILTEQAEAWYYKSNLGDTDEDGQVQFTVAQKVIPKPSFLGVSAGTLSLQDLQANGEKQVVVDFPGVQGYFELDQDNQFRAFKAFETIANVNTRDANTRMLDINGDGQPEIIITEDTVFTWYQAIGKKGYQRGEQIARALDEEKGPAMVFSDPDQQESIYLADMSGDGLTDIVRVRNGEICYWANKGYGQFSAKVNMGNAPVFDHPDIFNPSYVQLADVSGTGATDIVYLGKNNFKAYINLSGNAWSEAQVIDPFFPINRNSQVSVVDLLGTGTSCIVWSSDLPSERHAPMRYIDLMGSKKPHLLRTYVNNLGKETRLEYRSSTYYYLQDKLAGTPWITKLPFPVQVIAKSVTEDKITKVRFAAEYTYHHGYYDHAEREFRGFGMVEQKDTEEYETWQANNAGNRLEKSRELYQAPTLTKTWFHTGAYLDRERILHQFEEDYWYEEEQRLFARNPLEEAKIVINSLLEGVFAIDDLNTQEHRQAFRACKGMMLRQEVFSLDAPTTIPDDQELIPAYVAALMQQQRPYTVATHNCLVQLLQPQGDNQCASFLVTEHEAITIHYERDETDPRIVHTINTNIDELGNILEQASIVYPRIRTDRLDDLLQAAENLVYERTEEKQAYRSGLERLVQLQAQTLITYSQSSYTNDVIAANTYRLRQMAETITYEITKLPKTGLLYQANDFANVLSDDDSIIEWTSYHLPADTIDPTTRRRPIEHVRTLYYDENLAQALDFGEQSAHGIAFESYQLAFPDGLLSSVFDAKIGNPTQLLGDLGKYVKIDEGDDWWIRSGYTNFYWEAEEQNDISAVMGRFYSPLSYVSPFAAETKVSYYKDYYLLVQATEDALLNEVSVEHFNFRMMAPVRMKDMNDNISEILLDELGLVKVSAVLAKGNGGDHLNDQMAWERPTEKADVDRYFNSLSSLELEPLAKGLLQGASSFFAYDFHRYHDSLLATEAPENDCIAPSVVPTVVSGIVRERHSSELPDSPIQMGFEYSDGLGNVVMTKTQAEPGIALRTLINEDCSFSVEEVNTQNSEATGLTPPLDTTAPPQLRWIGTGRTILNNKGNPVKQYEPYFSVSPFFEDHKDLVERGVTPIIYYDALGRNIRTEMPDGTLIKVEFNSWHQKYFDQNDTIADSDWYTDRVDRRIDEELEAMGKNPLKEKRAAELAARHADTPSVLHLDTLGRPVLSIEHQKVYEKDATGAIVGITDELYSTLIELDVEGNARKVIDARWNAVMEYAYDMLGHRLRQISMDAGTKWMLNNTAGNPLRSWDSKSNFYTTSYDLLQRPVAVRLKNVDDAEEEEGALIQKSTYGEGLAAGKVNNLRGQVYESFDTSGKTTNVRFDFKGNLLESQRRLAASYDVPVIDWTPGSPTSRLEIEVFSLRKDYDALNRMTRTYNWHSDTSRVVIYEPTYNARGSLVSEDHVTAAQRTANSYTGGVRVTAVTNIQYNGKGQRTALRLGNGTVTRYFYDPETYRLIQLRTTRAINGPMPSSPSELTDPNVLQNLYYTYDPVGNITEVEDDAVKPVFFQNQEIEAHCKYVYDPLYRLVEAEGRENENFNNAPVPREPASAGIDFGNNLDRLRMYTQYYDYDAVGNILRMRHRAGEWRWTRHYTYKTNNNQLDRTWRGDDEANAITYQHDEHGNMRNYNNTSDEFRPDWDYRDMVYHLNLGGGGDAYYQYSGERQRSRKRIERAGGIVEERFYLGGMELYRRWQGSQVRELIETHHLFVDDQRVLLVEDVVVTNNSSLGTGTLYRYQYSDHLGSVAVELDQDQRIISYEAYHPFGTLAYRAHNASITTVAKRYRYTGMERDEESGLNYHSARYYMPWLGRWLKVDIIGMEGGINPFKYVHNNPIGNFDSSGKQANSGDPTDPNNFVDFDSYRAANIDQPGDVVWQVWAEANQGNPSALSSEAPPQAESAGLLDSAVDWISDRQPAGAGAVTTYSSMRRLEYVGQIAESSDDSLRALSIARAADDLPSAENIARGAFETRNELRTKAQAKLPPGSKYMSEVLDKPPQFDDLMSKYQADDAFDTYQEITKASGRSRTSVKMLAKGGAFVGPVMTAVGAVNAVDRYNEAPPEEKARVAAEEAGGMAGGAVGAEVGTAGGTALAGLIAVVLGMEGPPGWLVLVLGAAGGGVGGIVGSEAGNAGGGALETAVEERLGELEQQFYEEAPVDKWGFVMWECFFGPCN